ncbi:MAG: S8 family serine peptidase, partial [Candidatus Krumholzibacteriia bacterium]
RERARGLADSLGWPAAGVLPGGKSFALQGIEHGIPFYYTTFNRDAARTTRTDSVQYYIGGGSDFTIGLWDGNASRTTHQELASRVFWRDTKTPVIDEHATHVAGTMIASGVRPQAKGMAPEARISAYQWDDDLAEMAGEASRGLFLSNHSYGYVRGWIDLGDWYWFGDTAISETEDYLFGFYSGSARAIDEVLYAAPNYLPVYSAGNDRNDFSPGAVQHYFWDARAQGWKLSTKLRDDDGAPLGYDCLSNGPAVAKNALTIGAVEDVTEYTGPESVVMTPFSSWGPTDDGRIKPDICGNGWAVYSSVAASDTSYETYYGTSMASPNVCGSLALLQDYYKDHHGGVPMKAATLKALALHTAREAGDAPGPDYSFGWGLLDAYAAYRHIELDLDDRKGLIEEYTLSDGVPVELYYRSTGTASELRVTVCWTDPAGTPPAWALDPADLMLVNDLDIRVDKDGALHEPWVLDPLNPASPAAKGDNYRDNVEQVHIANPEEGIYVVRISQKGSLEGGSQAFSIVVSGVVRAKTWHVYAGGLGDAPTIAAAVDSASDGDQIFVYPGVYREHDIFVNKPLVIKGIRGPAITMVDAQGLGRCFTIVSSGAGPSRIEDLTLRGGSVEGDKDEGDGGAVHCAGPYAEIVGCIITQNKATRGGGVFISGDGALRSCKILANTAENGGGIYVLSGSPSIYACVVARNVASVYHGGGIACDVASPTISRCTVSHNAASGLGGGLYFDEMSGGSIQNTIVAFTLIGVGAHQDGSPGSVAFTCCDMFDNSSGDFSGGLAGQMESGDNFSKDPQFCDFARLDYRIGDGSPCLAGGNPCGELIGALGPHCHSKTSWYVRADGMGEAPTIQAAVDRAVAGDTIVLAAGVYAGAGNRDIEFAGKNLVIRSASGPDSTIVDCGGSVGEIHWGFGYTGGEDSTSALEGLTIRHAALTGIRCLSSSPVIRGCVVDSCITSGGARGGGFYIEKSSAKILGCTVTNNRVDTNGGGIYCKEAKGRIAGCVFSGNTAAKSGGGIAVQTSSSMDIVGCSVIGNLANTESGGGIYIISARARIDSCTIAGNTGSFGGGLFNGTNAFCTLKNSGVNSNVARNGGGGLYSSTNLTMENCTIVGNSAAYYGAGIESFYGNQNTIVRSIVAFNLLKEGIYTGSGTQTISCSDVYGNAGGNYGGSTTDRTGLNNNISSDPSFCDAGAFDYHLYDTSPCAPAASPCGLLIGAHRVDCRIAPNLVLTLVEYSRNVAPAHGAVFVTAVVQNTGAVDADSFAIDFYSNCSSAPGPGQAGDFRRVVHSLAVGDTVMFTAGPVTSDTIGEWKSWVAVDASGWVVETDETDNVNGPDSIGWIAPREPGWPVAIATSGRMSPLLVDADGTPGTLEVFAGSDDGNLYAWKSDGTPLAGWPVDCGVAVYPMAAGDITGDSGKEILACNASGLVMAYSSAGVKLWEYPATSGYAVILALADLDGDGKLEVLCGDITWQASLLFLEGDGTPYGGLGYYDPFSAPAAADVDGDGRAEIAVFIRQSMFPVPGKAGLGTAMMHAEILDGVYLFNDDGTTCAGWPVVVDPTTLAGDPVIGDVAGNHQSLEIVAAAKNGLVYAWDAAGNQCFPPVQVPGTIESSPALANFDSDGYLDIAVTSKRQTLIEGNIFWEGLTSVISGKGALVDSRKIWQGPSDPGALLSPIVIGRPPDALAATPDGRIDAADLALSFSCCPSIVSTPAAGDIDGDGWVEVLAVSGDDSLYAYELCTSHAPSDALPWPMFRRGPARSGAYGYEPVTGVDDDHGAATPSVTSLRSIYPNPFNPVTRIAFDVSAASRVVLAIYDVSGRSVAVLVDREMLPGRYEAIWNGRTGTGRNAASGIYFCRLTAGRAFETKKLVLLR